jgi:hypothetical protein
VPRRARCEEIAVQLYERLLGPCFARLPLALRRFHAQAGGEGRCTFSVRRAPGVLRGFVARSAGLPAATAAAPVTLRVRVQGERELWTRIFPDRELRSVQWIEDGRLIEQTGPLRLAFDVAADESGLLFACRGCRVFGMPLPREFAPRVAARVRGGDARWEVLVSVAVPGLGPIAWYGGTVIPA